MTEKILNLAGYKCRAIVHHASGVPIVFFHGFSYNIEVWQRIGVNTLLTEKHIPFLGLDMPYGMKSECQPRTRDPEKNVSYAKEAIENAFSKETPVLVGASIGGHMALEYASQFPVKGLLLVAPSRSSDSRLVKSYASFHFPVRIIWGTEDNIISGEEMRTLSEKLPKGKLVTYEGAAHSAYISQPDRFKRDLMELYAESEQT